MNSVTLIEQAIEIKAGVTPCIFRILKYKDGSAAGAVYSLDEVHRYILFNVWDNSLPIWMFCMLNPSTATEWKLDPTLQRQRQRSINGGAGGMVIVNAGAVRETKSALAARHYDPIGPFNKEWIETAIPLCTMHVCGWGPIAARFGGDKVVADAFRSAGVQLHCLELTQSGAPKHPLYTSYDTQPVPFYLDY